MSTITIAGNLAEDPTLRFTNSGRPVANLRVIENTQHRTSDGSYVDDDDPNTFHVVVWGKPAENVAESLGKGQEVIVAGTIRTESYTHPDNGQKRYRQVITADRIGAGLTYATVSINRSERSERATADARE